MKKILVLGGTRDAVSLATELSAVEGVRVIYSLAGVTREPIVPTCEVRIGGFGGVEGLQEVSGRCSDRCRAGRHPSLRRAHGDARCAGVRHGPNSPAQVSASGLEAGEADKWTQVASAEEALPHLAAARRIFLTIGVRELEPFAGLSNAWFLIRFINSPDGPLMLPRHEVLIDRGPFSLDGEMNLCHTTRSMHL